MIDNSAFLWAILETAVDAVVLINSTGEIKAHNRSAEKMFGYGPHELEGENVRILMPSPYREEHDRYLTHYLRSRQVKVIGIGRELVGQRKDGSVFPIDLALSEVKQGEKIFFTGIVKDITQRKRTEENEAYLSAIIESSEDAVVGLSFGGIITTWNSGAETIYGYSAEEVIGKCLRTLAPTNRAQEIQHFLNEVRSGKPVQRFDSIRCRKSGDTFRASLTISPIRSSSGNMIGVSEICRDITDRKNADLFLQQAKNAAESANKMKSDFLASMSHQFRTLLHAILSYARFGKEEYATSAKEELLDYFQKILGCSESLSCMVEELLEMSELDQGSLNIEFQKSDLVPLAHKIVDEFRSSVACKELSISILTPQMLLVEMDSKRITHVLRNLFNNAVKYSPNKSKIVLTLNQKAERLEVVVEDQGPGIPEDELESIFDRFAHSSRTLCNSGTGGAGLGLSISRTIVKAHKGRIWAENLPQGGAAISFSLPINRSKTEKTTAASQRNDIEDSNSLGSVATK